MSLHVPSLNTINLIEEIEHSNIQQLHFKLPNYCTYRKNTKISSSKHNAMCVRQRNAVWSAICLTESLSSTTLACARQWSETNQKSAFN